MQKLRWNDMPIQDLREKKQRIEKAERSRISTERGREEEQKKEMPTAYKIISGKDTK